MVACGHDVHRWEKLTDQDGDDRNHNAAGHCIQFIVPQFVLKLPDFEAGFGIVRGHDLLHPNSVIAGVRPRWLRTSRQSVKRFTCAAQIRHFVMAITGGAARPDGANVSLSGQADWSPWTGSLGAPSCMPGMGAPHIWADVVPGVVPIKTLRSNRLI